MHCVSVADNGDITLTITLAERKALEDYLRGRNTTRWDVAEAGTSLWRFVRTHD